VSVETDRDAVDLVPLDASSWRVCDPRYVDDGARAIIGYLSADGEQYEMLWMRPRPGVTRRYSTYEAAVEAICIRLRSID
jgi:hypothetical protein